MMNHWARAAADLLLTRPIIPDIDREIRDLVRTRPWPGVGAVLAAAHLELSHDSTEAEAVAWAASLIPFLRPRGWDQAPTGDALMEAVRVAYRTAYRPTPRAPALRH